MAFYLARQIGTDDGTAAEHNDVATALLADGQIVGKGENVAVGGHGDGDVLADAFEPRPVGGRVVTLRFGAGVDGQQRGAAFGYGLGVFQRQRSVVVAQSHFGAEHDVRRQPLTQGADDAVHLLRRFQQHGAALVLIDGGGGAAEIDVDALGAEAHGFQRVGGHHVFVAAQYLHGAGRAGGGAVAAGDFGNVPKPGGAGMDGVGDAHEFAHAFVVAADAGQQIAHYGVAQPLHRCQNQFAAHIRKIKKARAKAA